MDALCWYGPPLSTALVFLPECSDTDRSPGCVARCVIPGIRRYRVWAELNNFAAPGELGPDKARMSRGWSEIGKDCTKELERPQAPNQDGAGPPSRAPRVVRDSRLRAAVPLSPRLPSIPAFPPRGHFRRTRSVIERNFRPVAVWTVWVVAAGSPGLPFPYVPPSLPLPPAAAVGRRSLTP